MTSLSRPATGLLVRLVAASLLFLAPLLLLPVALAERSDAWYSVGLRGQTVLALTVSGGEQGRTVYAETSSGLWRQSGGETWQRIDAGLPRTVLGNPALAAWRAVPGRTAQLYALAGAYVERALYHSVDRGSTWRMVGPAPGQTDHPQILVLPGLGAAPDWIAVATSSRIQRSSDGGESWAPAGEWPRPQGERVGDGDEPLIELLGDASAPERLFALSGDHAVYVSDSAGAAWTVVLAPGAVTALSSVPHFGGHLYASTAAGLAHSTDGGRNWQTITSEGLPSKSRIVALRGDPRVPDTVYAALEDGRVLQSDDAGMTWLALGRPGARGVTALVLDTESRNVLYLASDDGIWARAVSPVEPTPVPTPSITPSPEPTYTSTPTQTPRPTATVTPSPSSTPTSTATPSPTTTASPTATRTPTRRPTRTASPTITATLSPTPMALSGGQIGAPGGSEPPPPTSAPEPTSVVQPPR